MTLRRPVKGTNLEYARSHNRRAVIEAVRRVGALSRAEIARETSLTGQTVSNIVAELEASGILRPRQSRRGARGQPSIPYEVDPRGAWSLGFHVDHRAIRGALMDLTGQAVALAQHPVRQASAADAAAILPGLARELVRQAGVEAGRSLAAGLALPVRFGVGPITTAGPTTLPGWDDRGVADQIAVALGMPVLIENDGTAAAIRERLAGVAQDLDSFVFLFLDDGLGAGIVLGGQPWRGACRNAGGVGHMIVAPGGRGASRNAGEIGHMIVAPEGRPCACGNRGCLERYVSLRAAYEAVLGTPDQGSPEEIAMLLARNDPALRAWVGEAAPWLGRAVNIVESAFDPDTIVIGGPAPRALLERLVAAAEPLPVSVGARPGRPHPRLILGGTGPDLAALGAASLPIFNETNPRFDLLFKR